MRTIILCGFMGCGKSTVGPLLAETTGRQFVDMDHYIEEKTKKTVSEIFSVFGEEEFRRLEREACRELAAKEDLVIAAGGGTLTFPENVAALAATGTIVYLTVSLETVLRRLKGDTSRPLLARPDREQAAQELLALRDPLYRAAAALTVNGENPPETVAAEIVRLTD